MSNWRWRVMVPVLALALAAAGAAWARGQGPGVLEKGTPVVLIGEISSQPRDFGFFRESKMQVAAGPDKADHTLHLGSATIFDAQGREIAKSDLLDKWWVRAEGTVMEDPRRIRVTRMQVVGKDWTSYRQSAFYRPGMERGYVLTETVAGARQVFPSTRAFQPGTHVVVVGEVSSQPRDAGVAVEEKMQVAIGRGERDFTLHMDDAVLIGPDGGEFAVSDFQDRMWVRAEGHVMEDARRIKVTRLRVIGDWQAYRSGPYFRTGSEYGYIVPMPHSR